MGTKKENATFSSKENSVLFAEAKWEKRKRRPACRRRGAATTEVQKEGKQGFKGEFPVGGRAPSSKGNLGGGGERSKNQEAQNAAVAPCRILGSL